MSFLSVFGVEKFTKLRKSNPDPLIGDYAKATRKTRF